MDIVQPVLTKERLETELYLAIKKHDSKKVDELLALGADSDTRFRIQQCSQPAICLAVECGCYDVVKALCESKCSIHQRNVLYQTPLQIAVANRNYRIMTLLLEHHADVDTFDIHGNFPVGMIIEYIIDEDIIYPTYEPDLNALDVLLSLNSRMRRTRWQFKDIFFKVCVSGNHNLVRLLLKNKFVSIENDEYNPLLNLMLFGTFNETIADLLLQYGANVNSKSKKGDLAIDCALRVSKDISEEDFQKAFNWCLKNGSNISTRTIGYTVLLDNIWAMLQLVTQRLHQLQYFVSRMAFCYFGFDVILVPPLPQREEETENYDTERFPTTEVITRQMVNILLETGMEVQMNLEDKPRRDNLIDSLKVNCANNFTLQNQCRISLLKLLGERYYEACDEIHLPKMIKRYLFFQDMFQNE